MQKNRKYIADCLCFEDERVVRGMGQNIIPPPPKKSLLLRYLEKFTDPIIIVLIVVFFFSVAVNLYEIFTMGRSWMSMLDSVGVLVALLLATGIGFIFEVRAEKEFEILNKVKDARPVMVYRRKKAGAMPRLYQIKKSDVVVGDIVKLESGDEIPADGVLVDAVTLRVDESNFTGELYANKSVDPAEFDADATYPSDFVMRGTSVIEGMGVMRVSAVGMETEEGKGEKRVQEEELVETPLNKQLNQLGHAISVISFIIAGLIIVGRLLYFFLVLHPDGVEGGFVEVLEFMLGSLMLAVTLIVVAVPEGLPMSVTISLALSMRKMLKENNLVRKLHACETMGAATVICTDKTGTLTRNQMTVMEQELYAPEELVQACIAVNSTAEINMEEGAMVTIGNPTEGALLKWLHGQGVDYMPLREAANVVVQEPFSSERKMMKTIVRQEDGQYMVYVKGAPEIVLGQCASVADDVEPERIQATLARYQQQAMRTLGFAYQRKGSLDEPDALVFMGVVGIADPLRDDVQEAIEMCKDHAGVRVIVVTGDTPGTARKIGREAGLLDDEERDIVLTAQEFNALDDEEATRLVADGHFKVLSRARPEDKVRLVSLLQRNGEVVAVTGDGTNDAPALRKAHVGLSMGAGTARAKEASDITIIDNAFSSINKAIMWGRSIYQNIRRFIVFQMTINVCACLVVLLGAFLGVDSPLTVTQMLWVNLIMDTFAAMALSSLPADPKVMDDKPRNPKSHIINRPMLRWIVGMGCTFFVTLMGLWLLLWHLDIDPAGGVASLFQHPLSDFHFFGHASKEHLSGYESAIFFTIFVFLQFWNLFNARYYGTDRSLLQDMVAMLRGRRTFRECFGWGFVGIILAIIVGQVLIVTFAGSMFNTAPMSLADWLLIILITSPVLVVVDIVRCLGNIRREDGVPVALCR